MTSALTSARPSRRTVVRGAAWSVPVVSVVAAAPAFAATCVNQTISYNWADMVYSPAGNTAATATFFGRYASGPNAGQPALGPDGKQLKVVMTLSSTLVKGPGAMGYNHQPNTVAKGIDYGNNLSYTNATVGGNTNGGIVLHQYRNHYDVNVPEAYRADRQELTLTMDTQVENFSITIADIDSYIDPCGTNKRGDFYDAVDVSNINGTLSGDPTLGAAIIQEGTSGLPWSSSSNNLPADETSSAANVTLDFTDFSSMTINYWDLMRRSNKENQLPLCPGDVDKNQNIFLTGISFTTLSCA